MSEHRLGEIVIERPRSGYRLPLKKQTGFKRRLHQLTEEATQDGLLRPYLIKAREKSKDLSDHLGPLRRLLRSRVGTPWNDVYSELCQRLDSRTLTGQHVWQHVQLEVQLAVELIDGIPYTKDSHWLIDRHSLYVHPETGLLCQGTGSRFQRKTTPKPTDVIPIDDYHQYRKLNGIWYHVTFEEFPDLPAKSVYDAIQGQIDRSQAIRLGKQVLYAARKQQCSKKEIRGFS